MSRDPNTNYATPCPSALGTDAAALTIPSNRRATDRGWPGVDVLSAEELASRLGCEPEHINALAAAHALPAVKIGRSWRFPAAAINAFLNQQAMAHLRPTALTTNRSPQFNARSGKKARPDLSRSVKVA
jgi:excisionase family DNA binding protein